jgi:plastocyanin
MECSRAHRGHLVLVLSLILGMMAIAMPISTPARAQDAGAAVQIVDFAFEPATLEIPVGTTVVWTNGGSAPHTVTSDTGAFDSGRLDPGGTFSMTFDTPGTYAYHCEFHPNMQATIVVIGGPTEGETDDTSEDDATATVSDNEDATADETPEANAEHPEHLAHIHAGTCDELGIVVFSLASLQSTELPPGEDDTEMVEMIVGTANVVLADLFNEPFSIHIHESEQNKQNYIACADIGEQPEAPWSPADGLALNLVEQAESGHRGIVSLRPDTGGAATVTLVLVADTDTSGDAQGETTLPPQGTTYTSPTYDYTITYGPSWTVEEEVSNDGRNRLVLSNGTSFVTATGAEAYNGDPESCVEGFVEQLLADPAVSNVELATDERGQPIQGGTEATGAFAVYDHDYTFANGTTEAYTLYVGCIPLVPGEAVLAFAQNVPTESYADQVAARQALLRGLTLPR